MAAMPSRRAFTLVELLVVIAIIGILATLLVPALARARELGRRAKCASNLHAIGRALQTYAHTNDSTLPNIESTEAAWYAVGQNNNKPALTNVPDGSRPLFMLMYVPDGTDRRKTGYVTAGAFICPSVSDAQPDPMEYSRQVGFTSNRSISYSFQYQINSSTAPFLTLIDEGARPILSDKNPLVRFAGSTGSAGGTTYYRVNSPTGLPTDSNSQSHGGDGQNVLRLSGTAEWTTDVAEVAGDNIWAPRNFDGSMNGTEPPVDSDDILLVP